MHRANHFPTIHSIRSPPFQWFYYFIQWLICGYILCVCLFIWLTAVYFVRSSVVRIFSDRCAPHTKCAMQKTRKTVKTESGIRFMIWKFASNVRCAYISADCSMAVDHHNECYLRKIWKKRNLRKNGTIVWKLWQFSNYRNGIEFMSPKPEWKQRTKIEKKHRSGPVRVWYIDTVRIRRMKKPLITNTNENSFRRLIHAHRKFYNSISEVQSKL